MNLVWGFVIATLLVVSFVGFENSWALKSQGVSQTGTNSGKICGVDFCDSPKLIDEKITSYLDDIDKSSIDASVNLDLDDIPHIIKTSIVSKDLRLIHYSDGNWQLIHHTVISQGLKQSQSETGAPQMEFGGTIDLGSGMSDSSLKKLTINESSIIRPFSDKIEQVKISGNVGIRSLPNVLITLEFPDKSPQDFIMPVDEDGNFDVELNIDKKTTLGAYKISAKYKSALIGSERFEISKHESSVIPEDELTNKIILSSKRIKIPSSYAQSFIIQVSGTLVDYHKGNQVKLSLETENGVEFSRSIPASRDGTFSTFVNITPEFPEGSHFVVLSYLGNEIARTPIIGVVSSVTLR